MNTSLLRYVRRTYNNPMAPTSTNRHNQRALARSIRMLGDKWLLARTQPLARRL